MDNFQESCISYQDSKSFTCIFSGHPTPRTQRTDWKKGCTKIKAAYKQSEADLVHLEMVVRDSDRVGATRDQHNHTKSSVYIVLRVSKVRRSKDKGGGFSSFHPLSSKQESLDRQPGYNVVSVCWTHDSGMRTLCLCEYGLQECQWVKIFLNFSMSKKRVKKTKKILFQNKITLPSLEGSYLALLCYSPTVMRIRLS